MFVCSFIGHSLSSVSEALSKRVLGTLQLVVQALVSELLAWIDVGVEDGLDVGTVSWLQALVWDGRVGNVEVGGQQEEEMMSKYLWTHPVLVVEACSSVCINSVSQK